MSSYQFVNSLTSCYGGPPTRPEPGSNPNPAEYYNPQAYNSCYGSAASAAAAAAAAGPASPAYPGSYLGQNGQSDHPHHSSSAASSHHGLNAYSSAAAAAAAAAVVCNNQQQAAPGTNNRLSHHQSIGGPNRTPTPSSCKYGPVDSASSPQDLSTSSTGAGQSSDGSRGSPQSSQGRASGAPASGGSSAPAAPATENNTNTTSSSTSSKGAGGSQPQIYPWMRKVHVGQSKFSKSEYRFISYTCIHRLMFTCPSCSADAARLSLSLSFCTPHHLFFTSLLFLHSIRLIHPPSFFYFLSRHPCLYLFLNQS